MASAARRACPAQPRAVDAPGKVSLHGHRERDWPRRRSSIEGKNQPAQAGSQTLPVALGISRSVRPVTRPATAGRRHRSPDVTMLASRTRAALLPGQTAYDRRIALGLPQAELAGRGRAGLRNAEPAPRRLTTSRSGCLMGPWPRRPRTCPRRVTREWAGGHQRVWKSRTAIWRGWPVPLTRGRSGCWSTGTSRWRAPAQHGCALIRTRWMTSCRSRSCRRSWRWTGCVTRTGSPAGWAGSCSTSPVPCGAAPAAGRMARTAASGVGGRPALC